jgi:hypothetical protein
MEKVDLQNTEYMYVLGKKLCALRLPTKFVENIFSARTSTREVPSQKRTVVFT